jgi:hypothetical protein
MFKPFTLVQVTANTIVSPQSQSGSSHTEPTRQPADPWRRTLPSEPARFNGDRLESRPHG